MTTPSTKSIHEMWANTTKTLGWSALPNLLYRFGHKLNLRGEHIAVIGNLWSRLNHQTGRCDPSIATIATELSWDAKTVRRHLHWLNEQGLVTYVERKNMTNNYVFDGLIQRLVELENVLPALQHEKQAEKAVAAPPRVEKKVEPVQVAPAVVAAPEPVQAVPVQMDMDYIPTVAELIQMSKAKDTQPSRENVLAVVKTSYPVSEVKAVEVDGQAGDFESLVRKGQADELAQEFTISGAPSYVQKYVLTVFSAGKLSTAQARTFIRDGVQKIQVAKPENVQAWWGDYCRSMAA